MRNKDIGPAAPSREGRSGGLLPFLRRVPLFSGIILAVFVIVGILGPVMTPHNPIKSNIRKALVPPYWMKGGDSDYILGTDHLGRDMLSRIISGTRLSLIIGFVAVVLSGLVGTVVALTSGYYGGWTDRILMRLTDTVISMPFLVVALVFAAVLGPSVANLILILSIVGWAGYARVLRSEVLSIKEADYVKLAKVAGCSSATILRRHIFPNTVNTLIVLATLQLGVIIIAEASLSFLGLGIPPPQPAWGLMVAQGRLYITRAPWLCLFPGLAIMFIVLACNLLGDWLRVRLDPKFRQI